MQSCFTATTAFAHTKCREVCGRPIRDGDAIVARPDGFRHLACDLNRHQENL